MRSARILAAALAMALFVPARSTAEPARVSAPASAPAAGKPAKSPDRASALGGIGGASKEPIKIDADRLDVFDRENKAVFKGNVVAIQGESTMKCTSLTVLYDRSQAGARPAGAEKPAGGESAIKRIDCEGPVTVVSKDQVATGDNAVFDRVANKVVLTGNVALSQCQNVTRGERIVYDMNTGVANVEGGRVRAMFVPGGKDEGPKQAGCRQAAPASGDAKARSKDRVQAN